MSDDGAPRRLLDPLRIGTVLLLLAAGTLVALVALDKDKIVVDPQDAVAPVDDKPAQRVGPDGTNANAEAILNKIEKKQVTSKKAKLLKSEMKKKLAAAQASSSSSGGTSAGSGSSSAPIAVLSGDAGLRKVFARKMRGVNVVDDASRGYFLSLRSESGSSRGTIFAKCSAAISELPAKKLVASLSSRADVSAEGYAAAELEKDAKEACAASLADDVSAWIRRH